MNGFIDIHSHILYGVDDGALDRSESIQMLQKAYRNGTKKTILTPHYHPAKHFTDLKLQRLTYRNLKRYLEKNREIQIYDGNEIYFTHKTTELLENGDLATLANSHYILLEFSTASDYAFIENAVRSLQMDGYWCVIAHVERYSCLRNLSNVESLVERGAYIQVNSSSVGKIYDLKTSKYIKRLLEEGLIHFIASDAHDVKNRTPNMASCYRWLCKHYDENYANQLMRDNAVYILQNERL